MSHHTYAMTLAAVKVGLPPAPHLPWEHIWILLAAFPPIALLLIANARMNSKTSKTGGDGRVIGIVGRMGSGKSFAAVRMALRRLKRGANVVTNFTMNLEPCYQINDLYAEGLKTKAIAGRMGLSKRAVRTLRGVTGTWRLFRGWDQFSEFDDAVIIIDEAHLYAPSNKTLVFPDVARFKLSQARKFRLDVYWITQHENRVNSVLRDHTNIMYVCRAWMSGAAFSVLGYEPEHMRRKGKHLERQFYRFNLAVANLYNTLEILSADDHLLAGSASMAHAEEVAQRYNAALSKRCQHERRSHAKAGTCKVCNPELVAPRKQRKLIGA